MMTNFVRMNANSHRAAGRRGATTVEFAVTAPIVFLFFFAAFEFSRMNMVRHTMDIAAYEGAREGITPGATTAEVTDRVEAMLAPVSVRQATVTVTPETIDATTREITVEVEVPIAPNSWITPRFLGNLRLRATSTLAREGFVGPSV
jgi:Flp pilus assembly protein TadG